MESSVHIGMVYEGSRKWHGREPIQRIEMVVSLGIEKKIFFAPLPSSTLSLGPQSLKLHRSVNIDFPVVANYVPMSVASAKTMALWLCTSSLSSPYELPTALINKEFVPGQHYDLKIENFGDSVMVTVLPVTPPEAEYEAVDR